MAKEINARIVHKHDTEAHYALAIGFIPKIGELIIYDPDENHTNVRFKFGDGITPVNQLPFWDNFISTSDIDEICGTVIEVVNSEDSEVKF